jgi:hypothetical protein
MVQRAIKPLKQCLRCFEIHSDILTQQPWGNNKKEYKVAFNQFRFIKTNNSKQTEAGNGTASASVFKTSKKVEWGYLVR